MSTDELFSRFFIQKFSVYTILWGNYLSGKERYGCAFKHVHTEEHITRVRIAWKKTCDREDVKKGSHNMIKESDGCYDFITF